MNQAHEQAPIPGGQDDPGDKSTAKKQGPQHSGDHNGVLLRRTDEFSEHVTSTPEFYSDVHENKMTRC